MEVLQTELERQMVPSAKKSSSWHILLLTANKKVLSILICGWRAYKCPRLGNLQFTLS